MAYFAPKQVIYDYYHSKPGPYEKEILEAHIKRRQKTCEHCGAKLNIVFNKLHGSSSSDDQARRIIDACPLCGWWRESMAYRRYCPPFAKLACIESYNITPFQASIFPLMQSIREKPSRIYSVSPRDLEIMVASILRGVFDCDVVHTGKSHDGGVDVLLLLSDNDPVIVQVKAHKSATSVEGVSLIRELLGAMVLKDASKGLFFTTADHFSPDAVSASEKLEGASYTQRIELIDCGRLVDMLSLVVPPEVSVPPWFIYWYMFWSRPFHSFQERKESMLSLLEEKECLEGGYELLTSVSMADRTGWYYPGTRD